MDHHPPRRWPLFVIGGLLFVLGPALYFAQCVLLEDLGTVAWYLPALSTLGVICMAVSLWQNGGVARGIGLAVFTLVCAAQWLFLGILTRTPDYQGPATVGNSVPAFAAVRATGEPFTQLDLQSGPSTILLFYRGHW